MGVFDKDLIQKDLSIEDILRSEIIRIASNVVDNINETSAHGVCEFSRMTDPGTYGIMDQKTVVWPTRYAAFLDYMSVKMDVLKDQLNKTTIIHNKKSVLINNIKVLYNIFKYNDNENKVPYIAIVDYSLRSGVMPFVRTEQYRIEICFDIFLDPPLFDKNHFNTI